MNVFTREGFIFLNGKDYTIHEIRVYKSYELALSFAPAQSFSASSV